MGPRRRIVLVLVAIETVFVITTVARLWVEPSLATFLRPLDLDQELSVPTWFSSGQLLVIGLLVWLSGTLAGDGCQPSRRAFALVGLSFIYLSMDETAGIHEAATRFLDDYPWAPRFSQDNGIWIFVYLAILLALIGLLWQDFLAAFRDLRGPFTIIVGGFCLFVLGGVVVEALHYELVDAGTPDGWAVAQYAVEEFLEMLGGTIMLYGAMVLHEEMLARTADGPYQAIRRHGSAHGADARHRESRRTQS